MMIPPATRFRSVDRLTVRYHSIDRPTREPVIATGTRDRIIDAARASLQIDGHRNLSTRGVAERADVPLSQIHYHFGGRQGLLLSLLAQENERLLQRQEQMYSTDVPLWRRYEQACDYLEDDLASGYVRLLQEMIATGWSDPAVADQVTGLLSAWFGLLERVIEESADELGNLGPFGSHDLAALVGVAFMGSESMLLLDSSWAPRVLPALRAVVPALKNIR